MFNLFEEIAEGDYVSNFLSETAQKAKRIYVDTSINAVYRYRSDGEQPGEMVDLPYVARPYNECPMGAGGQIAWPALSIFLGVGSEEPVLVEIWDELSVPRYVLALIGTSGWTSWIPLS